MSKKILALALVLALALTVVSFASAEVEVGDTVTFGVYEQDNDLDNGKEPIEWDVLAVKNGKALLASKYVLDAKPYNKKYTSVRWADSSLRKWLNGSFMNKAFTDEEKAAIATTKVDNSRKQRYYYYTNGGKSTKDQVFVLSFREVYNKYTDTYLQRRVSATEYAKAQGVVTYTGSDLAYWWLRNPGWDYKTAQAVQWTGERLSPDGRQAQKEKNDDPSVHRYYATRVNNPDIGVRPALWVDVDAVTEMR